MCDAARQNRLRMEAIASQWRKAAPPRAHARARSKLIRHVKSMGEAVGPSRARALCPWRDKLMMERLRKAARDGSSLNLAFGKTFWQPGVGLKEGQQWKYW